MPAKSTRVDTKWPGVYVLVDEPCDWNHRMSMFEGCNEFPKGVRIRWVHVISQHAGGEVLGYALLEDGSLHVRLPNYAGHWPEMHVEVTRIVVEHATGQTSLPLQEYPPERSQP